MSAWSRREQRYFELQCLHDFLLSIDKIDNVELQESRRARFHWQQSVSANFQIPADALRPVVEKIRGPQIPRDAGSATATVQFEVNEKGSAVNVKVEKTSDEGWGRDVTEALREWKFTPARKDGAALAVSCTMDFVRAN
jgi:TonB family protein